MLIEAVDHPIRYRFSGGEIRLEPGRPVEVEPERAVKLLARAGAKVRAVGAPSSDVVLEPASPTAPLHPGWLVAYRDRHGDLVWRVCGPGARDGAGVPMGGERMDGAPHRWATAPLSLIRSVGQTDDAGQIVAAWTVKEHGYDGAGPITQGGQR